MLKLLAGKWLYVAGGVLVLSLAVTGRAYLGERDTRITAEEQNRQWEASYQTALDALDRQSELRKQAEQARIRLADENAELKVQQVHIVTEIREVFRDREVVTEVQADCSVEPVPSRVVRLRCDAAASRSGICAMREDSSGFAGADFDS